MNNGRPGNNIARIMTRKITLADGNKLRINPPRRAYEAVVSSAADVGYYEESASYTMDGITYGEGVIGRNIAIPVSGDFYISGTTSQIVYITFTYGG
jgi:hypothetical protein